MKSREQKETGKIVHHLCHLWGSNKGIMDVQLDFQRKAPEETAPEEFIYLITL